MAKNECKYTLEIRAVPLDVLNGLPKNIRQQIGYQLDLLQRDFRGDIKKLKGYKDEYPLRAGSYRVLFRLIGSHLIVYKIGDRKDIYGR
jgi:mRNA-degrading endonuclease RelE of RelBE toxin-antitoxin system